MATPLIRLARLLDPFWRTYEDRAAFFYGLPVAVLDKGSSATQMTDALRALSQQDRYALHDLCIVVREGQTMIGTVMRQGDWISEPQPHGAGLRLVRLKRD